MIVSLKSFCLYLNLKMEGFLYFISEGNICENKQQWNQNMSFPKVTRPRKIWLIFVGVKIKKPRNVNYRLRVSGNKIHINDGKWLAKALLRVALSSTVATCSIWNITSLNYVLSVKYIPNFWLLYYPSECKTFRLTFILICPAGTILDPLGKSILISPVTF